MPRFRLPGFVKQVGTRLALHSGWLAFGLHAVVLAGIGLFALQHFQNLRPLNRAEVLTRQEVFSMDFLERCSYDLPFLFRHFLPRAKLALGNTDEAVIVYMDDKSTRELGQSVGGSWSRAVHARLLDYLTKDGARAVFFDIIFEADTPEDAVFAQALTRNGRAFVGATLKLSSEDRLTDQDPQQTVDNGGMVIEELKRSNRVLSRAGRGWGLLTFRPVDSDYGVRRLYVGKPRPGLDPWPTSTWLIAQMLGAELPVDDDTRFAHRWVNYYGPAGQIKSVGYHRPLVQGGDVPPGFFKDKVVFVGARTNNDVGTTARKILDEFSTPWRRFRAEQGLTPGVEIHATIFLNLLHHEWLERLPFSTEQWFVVLLGIVLGALRWLRPLRAGLTAVLGALVIFVTACLLQWQGHVWWNWSVPVFLQIPLATLLAVGSRYYIEERGKRKLRNAFGFYLSPDLASEIAERDFTLAPGGEKVLATMVFTDLEGFTTLSEKLGDSARLGEELTRYFTRTTDEILAEKGTVIKFIGDAVFAAWGAPLPQADQAERAVRAAWKLSQVSEMDVSIPQEDGTTATVHVRTRIGIHTGEALAGNLGSARRFDYTLIGDAVNFAARLEGANKYTGTAILLSDDTAQRLGGKFLLRRLGAFKVKGKGRFVVIHELLGDNPAARPPWLDTFDAALAAWFAGDFAAAKAGFESVKAARGGKDGPSQFYLDRVNDAIKAPGWTGEVELEGK